MYIEKYLKKLDMEIEELIECESDGITWDGERRLHVLLENCKHVKMLYKAKEMHGAETTGNPY